MSRCMARSIHEMVDRFKFETEVRRPYFGAATITVASCGYNWDVF